MHFAKQVLILKDVREQNERNNKQFTGIARIESDGDMAEFFLSFINCPVYPGAEFFALVVDKNKNEFSFSLGARPVSLAKVFHSIPYVNDGLSIGIYALKDNIPLLFAFAKSDDGAICLTEFKKIVVERQLDSFKLNRTKLHSPQMQEPLSCPVEDKITQPTEFKAQENEQAYNDEAVATTNYFEFDKEISKKIDYLKEFKNDVSIKDELLDSPSQKTQAQERESACRAQNETSSCSCEIGNHSTNYYKSVEQELNCLFDKYPTEDCLEKLFSCSRWAKIVYAEHKHYVVGVIKENKKEKYICYGVPALYSPTPPEQLRGYCSFVPASIFNMKGQGYWMLFQDAHSGKCILHE